jgi:hypothetical protein
VEQSRMAGLLELGVTIEGFQFCGPSDDPDEITAVVYGFKAVAKRFIAAARRLRDHTVQAALTDVDVNIDDIYAAYDLHSGLQPVIDLLKELAAHPERCEWLQAGDAYVAQAVIESLREVRSPKFDLTKLIGYCNEMNTAYALANYLSCVLLIRAVLNHVPPIYGHTTFQQVVSQAGKSLKEVLKPLEDVARDIADLHTHSLIGRKETLPTKHQVEPFKASFELLLQDIVAKLHASD